MRHAFLCLLISLLMASTVPLIIYLSDPYGLWNTSFIEPTQRRYLEPRLLHPLRLHDEKFDVVFLGSSRIREGIDTRYISNTNAYNAGFSGATMFELARLLELMGEAGFSGTVIVGIDFFGSSPKSRLIGASIGGPLDNEDIRETKLKTLWGIDYLFSAFRNIKAAYKNDPAENDIFLGSYQKGETRHRFSEGLKHHFTSSLSGFDPEQTNVDADILEELTNGIHKVNKAGGHVILFATPVHASTMYLNKLAGLSEHYNSFINSLIKIVNQSNKDFPGKSDLWDFSSCDKATKESIPEDPNRVMDYFFDASHFTPALGEMIVQQVLFNHSSIELSTIKLAPSQNKSIFSRDWDACHTNFDAKLKEISENFLDKRCLQNPKWCKR